MSETPIPPEPWLNPAFLSEFRRDLGELETAILQLESQPDAERIRTTLARAFALRGRCSFVGKAAWLDPCDRIVVPLLEALEGDDGVDAARVDDWLEAIAHLSSLCDGQTPSALPALPPAAPTAAPPKPAPRPELPVVPIPPGLIDDFLEEARDHLLESEHLLLDLERGNGQEAHVHELFRRVHSLKGGAGIVLSAGILPADRQQPLDVTRDVAHRLETLLQRIRDGVMPVSSDLVTLALSTIDALTQLVRAVTAGEDVPAAAWDVRDALAAYASQAQAEPARKDAIATVAPSRSGAEAQTIRVEKVKLDHLMDQMGELLITRGALQHMAKSLTDEESRLSRELREIALNFGRISRGLQDTVMDLRMQEVRAVFQRFPRVVRDIAQQQGKRIRLELAGEETRLDKTVIERIGDPLMHLVRNAADHGIESPTKRLESGKPEEGRVVLRAEQRGNQILLTIEDDGHGMDAAKLKRKAVEKGLLTESQVEGMSDRQAYELIFLPGFSMAAQVTDISGRGVGMDVVRTNIQQLNGSIEIESRLGEGSRITVLLPMSLAVSDGMLFEAGGETFVIPVEQVVEAVKVPRHQIHDALSGELMHLRGDVLAVCRLDRMLGLAERPEPDEVSILVIRGLGQRLGLVIDRPLREQEIIVKPLQESLQALPGLSGATILGDGRVLLILDADKLVALARQPVRA